MLVRRSEYFGQSTEHAPPPATYTSFLRVNGKSGHRSVRMPASYLHGMAGRVSRRSQARLVTGLSRDTGHHAPVLGLRRPRSRAKLRVYQVRTAVDGSHREADLVLDRQRATFGNEGRIRGVYGGQSRDCSATWNWLEGEPTLFRFWDCGNIRVANAAVMTGQSTKRQGRSRSQ